MHNFTGKFSRKTGAVLAGEKSTITKHNTTQYSITWHKAQTIHHVINNKAYHMDRCSLVSRLHRYRVQGTQYSTSPKL